MKKILPLLLLLSSCIGAGDIFAGTENIKGNYYLIENDNGHFDLAYKTGSDYIGRSPSNSEVMAYAIKDSFLVIKCRFFDSTVKYCVLNMNRDRDVAKEEEYLIDTIAQERFPGSWIGKQQLKFRTAAQ